MDILIERVQAAANRRPIYPFDDAAAETPMQEFYNGKTVLITGGTGFIGKLLLEKLLSACPNLRKVYLLIRLKYTLNTHHRLVELFDLPLFDDVRTRIPNVLDRVELIKGDLSLNGLGLTHNDRCKVIDEVDVVFNCGAATMTNSSLRSATEVNVNGLEALLKIAHEMRQLKGFVHVSSSFAACGKRSLDENFQRPLIAYDALLSFVHSMDPNCRHPKPIFLDKWPNNYLFTKCIGEDLLKKCAGRLPVVIVRLPLVLPTYLTPIPGWSDDTSGLMGLIMTLYIGLNKSVLAAKQKQALVIPAEMAVNAMLVACFDTAMKFATNCNQEVLGDDDQIPIYNVGGSLIKPITWGQFFGTIALQLRQNPTEYLMAHPWHLVHGNHELHTIICVLLHYIPAHLHDFLSFYVTAHAKYLAYYTKASQLSDSLNFYLLKDWEMRTERCLALHQRLNAQDQALFGFNMCDINWPNYFRSLIIGLRVNVLKDTNADRRHALKIYHKHLISVCVKLIVLVGLIVYIFNRMIYD